MESIVVEEGEMESRVVVEKLNYERTKKRKSNKEIEILKRKGK